MATADDLVGVGTPPLQASLLSSNPNTLTCTGTSQATAAAIKSKNTELSPASSQTGAILPSGATVGGNYNMFNGQSTSAVIYCPVGHLLNGTSNNSLTLAQNKAAIMFQYKKSNWWSILTA